MKRSINSLLDHLIVSKSGKNVGRCNDILIDEDQWAVRYLEIDTGSWLPGRRVLISPISVLFLNSQKKHIHVALTEVQIEKSPPLESHIPVSRKWELQFHQYHEWPHYATGLQLWGSASIPSDLLRNHHDWNEIHRESKQGLAMNEEPNLRLFSEIQSYQIQGTDETFGSLKDLIFDSSSWEITHFVVDTIKWLPSKQVIMPVDLVKGFNYEKRTVSVECNKDKVKDFPEFDSFAPVNRELETRLYDYYGRPLDWLKDESA